jgi:hypothetical protein
MNGRRLTANSGNSSCSGGLRSHLLLLLLVGLHEGPVILVQVEVDTLRFGQLESHLLPMLTQLVLAFLLLEQFTNDETFARMRERASGHGPVHLVLFALRRPAATSRRPVVFVVASLAVMWY